MEARTVVRSPLFGASLGAASAGVIWAWGMAWFGVVFGIVGFLLSLVLGTAFGYAFGHRERDVAFPMPIATPIVGFAAGLLFAAPVLFVLLAATRRIGGP